jgi:hypothetical protein
MIKCFEAFNGYTLPIPNKILNYEFVFDTLEINSDPLQAFKTDIDEVLTNSFDERKISHLTKLPFLYNDFKTYNNFFYPIIYNPQGNIIGSYGRITILKNYFPKNKVLQLKYSEEYNNNSLQFLIENCKNENNWNVDKEIHIRLGQFKNLKYVYNLEFVDKNKMTLLEYYRSLDKFWFRLKDIIFQVNPKSSTEYKILLDLIINEPLFEKGKSKC